MYVGADQQSPAPLFVRFVAPTDLDQARKAMVQIIKAKYSGNDLFNIALWRKLGWEGGPVNTFLTNYMLMARTRQTSPANSTLPQWKGQYLSRYPGSVGEDVEDYFDALMQARAAQLVSDTIWQPWDYSPETPLEEFAASVGKAATSGFNKILVAGAIVGLVYLIVRRYTP